jgi:hypothetical protein
MKKAGEVNPTYTQHFWKCTQIVENIHDPVKAAQKDERNVTAVVARKLTGRKAGFIIPAWLKKC